MSTKLYELLAVSADREAAATAVLAETLVTFTKKPEHFIGKHSIYQPFDEGAANEVEEASKELVETVMDKLAHCFDIVGRAVDVVATIDYANTLAIADIVVGTQVIATGVPATTLLMLENRLKRWQDVLLAIPTLAPGRKWAPDTARGAGVYVDSAPEARFRTKKVIQHKILVESTEHHPAQIEKWSEDVRVGKVVDTNWSSMISPADKSRLLARTQELLAAVKQARQRANSVETSQVAIAKNLTDFIVG
jgi:hypothetical protein